MAKLHADILYGRDLSSLKTKTFPKKEIMLELTLFMTSAKTLFETFLLEDVLQIFATLGFKDGFLNRFMETGA